MGTQFYTYPGIGNNLVSYLFKDAVFVAIQHWKTLTYILFLLFSFVTNECTLTLSPVVLKPIILGCPTECFGSVLDPLLSPLFTFITDKLDKEWQNTIVQEDGYLVSLSIAY